MLAGWAGAQDSAGAATPVRQLVPKPTEAPLPPLHPGPRAAASAHAPHAPPKPVQKSLFPIEEEPCGSGKQGAPAARPEQHPSSGGPHPGPEPHADVAGLPARLRRIRVAPGLHPRLAPLPLQPLSNCICWLRKLACACLRMCVRSHAQQVGTARLHAGRAALLGTPGLI